MSEKPTVTISIIRLKDRPHLLEAMHPDLPVLSQCRILDMLDFNKDNPRLFEIDHAIGVAFPELEEGDYSYNVLFDASVFEE